MVDPLRHPEISGDSAEKEGVLSRSRGADEKRPDLIIPTREPVRCFT